MIGEYSSGLATAVVETTAQGMMKFCYINAEGHIAIKGPFTEAQNFSGEVAMVENNGRWGYIDRDGNYIWQSARQGASSAVDAPK